jgi:hypothetical protein
MHATNLNWWSSTSSECIFKEFCRGFAPSPKETWCAKKTGNKLGAKEALEKKIKYINIIVVEITYRKDLYTVVRIVRIDHVHNHV